MMHSFGTPGLVWVKRKRDDGVASMIRSDTDAEPLNAHGSIVARRSQAGCRPPEHRRTARLIRAAGAFVADLAVADP